MGQIAIGQGQSMQIWYIMSINIDPKNTSNETNLQ